MKHSRFLQTAGILSGIIALSTFTFVPVVQAQEVDNNPNVYAGGAFVRFDEDWRLENQEGFLVGGELPLSQRWSGTLEYWKADTDFDNTNIGVDVPYYRIGGNYHLDMIGNGWQPYFGVGLGQFEFDPDNSTTTHEEPAIDLGIGVKKRLVNNLFFRGDVKSVMGTEKGEFDMLFGLSLGYNFGGGNRSVASTPTNTAPASAPQDSDGDGVTDNLDNCRNTPAGTVVDARGCELDSDRDGVVDSRDNCPDTSIELAVDSNGCPILEVTQRRQELLVNFDFDQAVVKPEYADEIEEFADFMIEYGNTSVTVEGHTDSVGTEAYNQGLSERRANAVMNVLIQRYDIPAGRLSAIGYGESRPLTTNDTDAGRERNRRIEAAVSVDVEEARRR